MRQVSAGAVIEVKPATPASANFGVHADYFELYSIGLGHPGSAAIAKAKDILTGIERRTSQSIFGESRPPRVAER